MKCKTLLTLTACVFGLMGCKQVEVEDSQQGVFENIRNNFKSPDRSSSVNCWWWWLNGNVTKEAIVKDLEAMKSKSFQGAMIFDAGGHNQRGNKDLPDGPLYGSPEWIDLFVFALDNAERLGLEIGFNIQSGWNLGGPCVTPQYAAKQLTFSEVEINGGKNVQLVLKQPQTRDDFYRDIAVLAFPVNDENRTRQVIEALDYKLGFHELGGSAPDCRFLLENEPRDRNQKKSEQESYLVRSDKLLNLTDKMTEKGNLEWNAPEGKWKVMRIGYTCTNSVVSTSSNDWQGRVLDYMSQEAFDFYWNTVVEPILQKAGHHVGKTLTFMETDSWECGGMNWTDSFVSDFQSYCGYDPISYLPLVGGYIVDNVDKSNAFLADFRKTIAHLVAEKHYGRFAEYAHKYHMGIQPESAGPHAGPLDGIKNYAYNDIVMSEFWSPSPHRPNIENRFFLKQASSTAHIYGKKIVGAESFTTIGPHWNDELWHDQKSSFDHEICSGLNRVYFHTFTCSPKEQGVPGQEYFAGTHVNPQVTWWKHADAFVDYIHRVQSIVQEGQFVADVLYYYGDHVPNVFPYKHSDPAGAMFGFDYDVTDEDVFMQLKVENGKVVVPSGISYHVLVLPEHRILSYKVLNKIEELVSEGAHVIGYKPEKAVSLVGGEKVAKNFKEQADKVWGISADSEKGSHIYGKGSVSWGISAKEYLLAHQIPVDFKIEGNESKMDFDYIHYSFGKTQVYFVSNQTEKVQKVNAQFRISGMQPELWNALSGDIREAEAFTQKKSYTSVPLTFEPYGSTFVVFHESISSSRQGKADRNYPDYEVLKELTGEWTVNFDTEWGGPASVVFPELQDWTTHTDKGIKYYSGTAVYHKTFTFDSKKNNSEKYFIQLENVKDVGIATIRMNGVDKGITWTKPFRVDVTDALKEGENILEVSVTNSWYNRVAGDEMNVAPKKYTKTNIVLSHDFRGQSLSEIPLEPSGLLGPVTLRKAVN